METSSKSAPYVYKCIHKKTGKFYIGYRCANVKIDRTSDVDFPLYKTSSKIVKPKFDEYHWIILAEFFNKDDAYNFEQELIAESWKDPLLINKRYDFGNKWRPVGDPWNKGLTKSNDNRVIATSGCFPINHTPWNAGLPTQDQVWFGKKHTEKSKLKMRKPKEKVTCPHCGMVGGISQMKRWHYNNCKLKAAI